MTKHNKTGYMLFAMAALVFAFGCGSAYRDPGPNAGPDGGTAPDSDARTSGGVADADTAERDGALEMCEACPGGTPEPIAEAEEGPRYIAVDDTHVYWTNSSRHEVMRRPKNGGNPELLAAFQLGAGDLALDATHVYWTNSAGDEAMRIAKNGGTTEVLASAQDGAAGMALDATRVYWTNFNGSEVMGLRICCVP